MTDLYLLEVSPNHRSGRGRWWGPNRQGYTDKIENAGLYTADQLDERDCIPRTVASVLEEIEAPARALVSRAIDFARKADAKKRTASDAFNNPRDGDTKRWTDDEGEHEAEVFGVEDFEGVTAIYVVLGDGERDCWNMATWRSGSARWASAVA